MFLFSPKKQRDSSSDSNKKDEQRSSFHKNTKSLNVSSEDHNNEGESASPSKDKTKKKAGFSILGYFGFGAKENTIESSESDNEVDEGELHENQIRVKEKIFCKIAELPENFAEEVLDLEMKIDSKTDFTQKDIDRLVYLYSQAMEYYEDKNKDKYISFKERIQKVLVNPIVFSRMKNKDVQTRDRCLTDTTGKRQAGFIKIDKNATKCSLGPSKLTNALLLKQNKEMANNK